MVESNRAYMKNLLWGLPLFLIGICLYHAWPILLPFTVALILAYLFSPLVEGAVRRLKLPRTLAALCVVLPFIFLVAELFIFLIPLLKNQISDLILKAPLYTKEIQDYYAEKCTLLAKYLNKEDLAMVRKTLGVHAGTLIQWSIQGILGFFSRGWVITNVATFLILTPLLTFYFLRDWTRILNSLWEMIPLRCRPEFATPLQEINTKLAAVIRGQIIVCICLSFYYSVALSVIGLEFSLLIGLLTGIFSFIPYLSVLIGFMVSLLMASSEGWSMVSSVIAVFAIGQALEGILLTPRLIGGRVGLHPVWILFSILMCGWFLGLGGVILAIPLASIASVLGQYGVQKYKNSPYYKR